MATKKKKSATIAHRIAALEGRVYAKITAMGRMIDDVSDSVTSSRATDYARTDAALTPH